MFTTDYSEVINLINKIDPIKYAKSRNYINGQVTRLSPYLSRGVISTKQIAQVLINKGYKPYDMETLLKELAWRDYFQQVWVDKKEDINQDLKHQQEKVSNYEIPTTIINYTTGIDAIDQGIKELYHTGYVHNHVRMYLASICCNIGQCHWLMPAKWMYYHLLDADWASNALSWQWVAGSFSSKKYYANQENINKFCFTNQQQTFLDFPYEKIALMDTPDALNETTLAGFKTNLPKGESIDPLSDQPFCVYTFYNLDTNWMRDIESNRVLLLEPSFFNAYPVSDKTIHFILALAENIPNIKIVVGEFDEVFKNINPQHIHFKEHPTNEHFSGNKHNRDWLFESVKGYYPSFSAYWKKCEKYLKTL